MTSSGMCSSTSLAASDGPQRMNNGDVHRHPTYDLPIVTPLTLCGLRHA